MEDLYYPTPIIEPEIVEEYFKYGNGVPHNCVRVVIAGEDYDVCERVSQKYAANDKKGAYGEGLGNSPDDPRRVTRVGLLGQTSFSKLVSESVDIEYREHGDKYDNLISGIKYDVKCAMTKSKCEMLIYHRSANGALIPLDKDIYVGGYVRFENRETKTATVIMVGYITRENVLKCSIEPGRLGDGHLNYVVPYAKMSPIVDLIEKIKSEKNEPLCQVR